MYENVAFTFNNFCIGALVDTFCSIDTTNVTAVLQVKNSSGITQASYSLNPTITQGVDVKSLEYPAARGTSTHADGMPFWTLERNSGSQCTIKKWTLNSTLNRLDLSQTIVKTTVTGSYHYDCHSMALEYYQTAFDGTPTLNSGKIKVDSTTHMEIGDALYLGPSTHPSYTGDFETVEVTAISGSWAYITVSGSIPPSSLYYDGNVVSFVKSIFLFSDVSSVSDKGSLIKLDVDGTVIEVENGAQFSGIRASSFGLPYSNTIGFVKGNNLLYVDIDDYEIKKSAALTNIKADEVTVIPVYDVAFTATSIYRLQSSTTRRNDDGSKTDYDWTAYNYHLDGVYQYVDSITLWAEPSVSDNQGHTTLYALVRDQYGGVVPTKTVTFNKTSGDSAGSFDDPNKQGITNSSGIAAIGYTFGWYDPSIADTSSESVYFTAKTDGSNVYTGSQYVWDAAELKLNKKFISKVIYIVQKLNTFSTVTYLRQIPSFTSILYVPCWSKFQFPGGSWTQSGAPSSTVYLIEQRRSFSTADSLTQKNNQFSNVMPLYQWKSETDYGQLSQTYVSRHLSSGHKDTAEIAQFQFIIEARPAFWSEKNPVDTNIWIKLAPYGFSLNQSTLRFRVKEVSYAGDTGWIDYDDTAYMNVSTWDAGGGMIGLIVEVNPPQGFHHNGIVFVYIEVYDQAGVPNIIKVDYWFKIVPDFQAPYITNESPAREDINVSPTTDVSFDVIDAGVGVDISTLEFYVNNRIELPIISVIYGGYHITFDPSQDFFYGETVEITVKIKDASDYENTLYDMWRFHIEESTGPWFDPESYYPDNCQKGVYRKQHPIYLNVYDVNGSGVDMSSIEVYIGGKKKAITITPIIYRLT